MDRQPSLPFPAVLFDLDGTLIDGYPAIAASANAVRAAYSLGPLDVAAIRPFVGRSLEAFLAAVTPGTDPAGDSARYRVHYARTMIAGTTLQPGAGRLLDDLVASGCKLAVCSNKLAAFSSALLEQLGIAARVTIVVGPEHVSRPKPAPDMLVMAAELLGCRAQECLFVGDMSVDIQAARAAGMFAWVVPTGSESADQLRAAGPDRLFDDLHSLRHGIFSSALDSATQVR